MSVTDNPKGQVCAAFSTVSAAVFRYTNVTLPSDLGAALPMSGGSAYLLRNLPSNAEPDLSSEVRSFAGTLDTIAMKLLAGVPDKDPELTNLLKSADDANKKIAGLCK